MRVGLIPTRLLHGIPRETVARSQLQLAEAQKEVTTGRHSDVGLALGARTGSAMGLRLELADVSQSLDIGEQAGIRTDMTQSALSALAGEVRSFRSTLLGARGADNGRSLAATAARAALDAMKDHLATTYDGQYLFGGINSGEAPLKAYGDGPRQAILDAFQAEFGFTPDDPAASALTPAQIETFLDGSFESLFSGAGWTTWSNAADENMAFRNLEGEPIDLSANANAPFARALARAFGMVETLGEGKLSGEAYQAVVDRALALASEGELKIGTEQTRIGVGQGRLRAERDALEAREERVTSAIRALEGVDPYEASMRVNLLMQQLETSYALTGRISRMSLLSYI